MWYFSWILGLAVAFGIINGMWNEFRMTDDGEDCDH